MRWLARYLTHPLRPFLFIASIVAFCCAVLSLLCWTELISMGREVDAGSLIEAASTILTGILVALYLELHLKNKDSEKHTLCAQLDVLLTHLEELEQKRENRTVSMAAALIKKINVAATTATMIVKCIKLNDADKISVDFSAKITELRDLLTLTPANQVADAVKDSVADITVKEDILKLNQDRESLLATKIELLRQDIIRVKLKTLTM